VLTKLGKYEIKRELGRGAMGIVFEGFDPFIARTVAIKTVQKSQIDEADAEDVLNRFRREAQAAGRLSHPNIVSVYEYGEDGDIAFIAMEFIIGKELKSYFDKGERFQIKDSVRIMLQILDALDYSHERGVVHRDIKPSNIIITNNKQVKVVDFGIARIESSDLTQVGTVLGTPAYMSPEQFKGLVADNRSDIYSAGVILYQFLTGDRPFTGNPTTLMHKVLSQSPMSPSELNSDVSNALGDVVTKAMSKRAEERFQTVVKFKHALCIATGFAADSAGAMVDTNATLVMPRDEDATRVVSREADATLLAPRTPPRSQAEEADAESLIEFDMLALSTSIDKHLAAARRDASHESSNALPQKFDSTLITRPPVSTSTPAEDAGANASMLLAGLAHEAEVKAEVTLYAKPVAPTRQTGTQRLQETLKKISSYLDSFAKQIKKAMPTIKRSFNFGRRTIFSNVICQNAHSDSRKQSLADSALMDYVFLSIRLRASAPAELSRPRDMLEALQVQMNKVKLRTLDDFEVLRKGAQDEWVSVRLEPDFPIQIQFKANYSENRIEVHSLNVESFGSVSYKLKAEDVTPALMDSIGLYLLGRADKMPEALQRLG